LGRSFLVRALVGTFFLLSPITAIAAEIGCDLFFTEQDAASIHRRNRSVDWQQQGRPQRLSRRREEPVGGALWEAQIGGKAPFAKPLKGFDGAGVLEVVDDFDGDAYRAVYTVRFTVSSTSCTPSRRSQGGA
jgi:hypothetical protein